MRKTRFKGHETFYFREGWLSKALLEIHGNNNTMLFTGNNGISKLGVGSNMVKSIKYWLLTTDLLEYTNRQYQLTEIGRLIERFDPYLEDTFTLWILHTNIVRNYEMATTWNLFFNQFHADKFKAEDAKNAIKNYLINNDIDFKEKSLDIDVNLLLSMYTKQEITDAEENLVCPLSQLQVFTCERNVFLRTTPDLNDLDEKVILYAILKMLENKSEKYININELEEGEHSLANLFNINRVIINEYLDRLANQGFIRIEKTAGLNMVYIEQDVEPENIIRAYYQGRGIL